MHSVGTAELWGIFFLVVITVFTIDLVVLRGGKAHRVSSREALGWTCVWIVCALIFNLYLWRALIPIHGAEIAHQKALEFFTGYLIEKSLSVDNMFVILMIFHFFAVPPQYQRRVLLYGVLGALVMRLVMILGGVLLIQKFHSILYLFGIFLLFTGIKMLLFPDPKEDLAQNKLIVWLQQHIRLTHQFHEEKFFIRKNLKLYATPLFLVLILVEINDLIFALDSIPAIFAITNDFFIVFTSNMFAILGLRALYFLLANAANRFYLLKYGVALVLIFVGIKMLIAAWIKIPILLALSIVGGILLGSIILSLLWPRRNH